MLQAIGLSDVDSKLYRALINNPRSTALELSEDCSVSPRLAARTLGTFVRRGLASRLAGNPARFVAVPPDISIGPLLGKHEEELHRVRSAISELASAHQQASRHAHPAELVEVVTGPENIVRRAVALQDSTQALFRAIDKLPYVMPVDVSYTNRENRRLREGIEFRVLYDREAVVQPGKLDEIRASIQHGENARVLTNAPLKLWISDAAAALIPVRTQTTTTIDAAFVVYPCALLDALIALFEREWAHATPIRSFDPTSEATPPTDQPDEIARALLPLLAAGLTDEAIARTLGLSLRTLQRRLHDLMRALNATTRFQAGMTARDHGWV